MGRPKKNQIEFPNYKVKPETVDALRKTALQCGFKYGNTAAMGAFLDRLAEADPILVQAILKRS
jgi:hypothetical protein